MAKGRDQLIGGRMEKHCEKTGADRRRAYYWEKVRKYCERYKNFSWHSAELILNLAYVHDVLESCMMKTFSEFNLSKSAVNILMILYFGEEKGCKQQELSGLLLVSRANVTKVIDGLEKRKLVVRSSSREDRRARFIKLTAAGRGLAERIIPRQNEQSVRLTSGFSRNEINILNKLLHQFSVAILESEKRNKNWRPAPHSKKF
jgi:DNA-binding MarR family transcriptional regulator